MIGLRAIASAPGKAILFGEHAVVYGVTAIAAALSDLRIFVEIVRIRDVIFLIHLSSINSFMDVLIRLFIA
jgi:mevalonate kinase